MKKLCIYHGHCADGFGAAWVVRKALGSAAEFHAGFYGDAPPDVSGRDVILVDFSYKRDVLIDMARTADSILILDHHKTAEADLVELPDNVTAVFDMERSGAMITWNHFFPAQPPPALITRIQDRDLWQFKYADTQNIQACLYSHPYDFDIWDRLMTADLDEMAREGAVIQRKQFKDINESIAAAAYRTTIAGYDVPVLNAPYCWSSDAGNIMARGEAFAACYWDTSYFRVFSLRSAEDGLDVAEIAEKFGGGGHRHAAGFRLSKDRMHCLATRLHNCPIDRSNVSN